MKIVVLSPHRDDAAFSLALSLQRWMAGGHAPTVVTAFTITNYAPYLNTVAVSQISRTRRLEDERFAKALGGLRLIDLGLKDAPLRLGCGSGEVCNIQLPPEDVAVSAISQAMELHAADSILVMPLALGGHVDHRSARDASLGIAKSRPCAFYEDLPYATRNGAQADLDSVRNAIEARIGESVYPEFCFGLGLPVEFKQRIVMLYNSQINKAEAEVIAGFCSHYNGAERLWVNSAWRSLAIAEGLSVRQDDQAWKPLPA